ncbi:MAG: DUF374 domain-containing protein [Nitrospira sp.]|nr:DUF374 domain-containing protein [Nitrospira sp.]
MKQTVLGWLAWLLYRALSLTWRTTLREPAALRAALAERRPVIFAHWHGDELALLQVAKGYRLATLSSPSKDGRIMATLLRLLGARVAVGSSSRGGAGGLRALLRIAREGHNVSFAVDGPRGPIYKLKPGVLETARLLDCPIFYASVSCDRAFHLHRSWNRTFLPKPFARVEIEWRGPAPAIARADDPRDPQLLSRLEQLMLQAKRDARVPGQQQFA